MNHFFTLLICASSFLISCKFKRDVNKSELSSIINDTFLTMVDTSYYKTGSFLLVPGDDILDSTNKYFEIEIDTVINNETIYDSFVVGELPKNKLEAFKPLFNNSLSDKEALITSIDLKRITAIDQFILKPKEKDEKKFGRSYLQFFNPVIVGNKAKLYVSFISGPKAGVTKCFLFEKNNRWLITHEIEIERY